MLTTAANRIQNVAGGGGDRWHQVVYKYCSFWRETRNSNLSETRQDYTGLQKGKVCGHDY